MEGAGPVRERREDRGRSPRRAVRRRELTNRLGFFEKLGAWLGVWTPPRDVEVPPVPWRRIAVGSVVAALLLGGLAAVLVPAIDRTKERTARHKRLESQAIVRKQLAQLRADQRPRFGRTTAVGRAGVQRALERSITRDMRARASARTVDGPILRTQCERALSGRVDPRTGRAVFLCTAVRRDTPGPQNEPLIVGYSLVATVDLARGRFCWCKTNPLPGEHDTSKIPHVRPSRLCAGPLRRLL